MPHSLTMTVKSWKGVLKLTDGLLGTRLRRVELGVQQRRTDRELP
jgi:hypothetical protein